ncbi:MAG TPA: lytic murein transglycosylase, partial [Xanthomonadaceae bacterium]|nr:lytic murein transglycosylase [Xanthomonadaceae bacterium]
MTATAQPRAPDVRLQSALQAAERGEGVDPSLAGHPLYGWLEYARLRRDVDLLSPTQAEAFLVRYRGQAVAEAFREVWLASMSRRQNWNAFRAAWQPTIDSAALRCAELTARAKTGATDAQWIRDAQAMYRTGKSLPSECDAAFDALAANGGLSAALRWERIELAAAEWQPAVMRAAARGLPAGEIALANDYAAFLEAVHERALSWPRTARSRLIASHGLARLAKSVPATAEAQLPKYAAALGFSEAERSRVLYQAALWTVASYEPDSARRLAAVAESAYDDKLHEWRVREALARSDWRAALAGIRKMPAKQREDSRWTYFEARLAELAGDKATANAAYARAARKPEFHGFLAADRLGQPYALCPWLPTDSVAVKSAVARDPAIQRAMALYALDRSGWAQREWDETLSRFDDTQRRHAVEVAQQHGWFDRAVFALGKTPKAEPRPDELRLYPLRFPLYHQATIRREAAKHSIDPAWVAAEIRAESIFN